MAGVLLSRSSFRHQLKADIEPFRGLLVQEQEVLQRVLQAPRVDERVVRVEDEGRPVGHHAEHGPVREIERLLVDRLHVDRRHPAELGRRAVHAPVTDLTNLPDRVVLEIFPDAAQTEGFWKEWRQAAPPATP